MSSLQLYSHRKILVAALNGPVMGGLVCKILNDMNLSSITQGIAAGIVAKMPGDDIYL